MKRIAAIFLSLLMLVSTVPAACAQNVADTKISFDLTADGEHTVTVPTGTVITVTYALNNKTADEPFTVTSLTNEIYFDHTFFELVEGSIEKVFSEYASLQKKSWGEHRIYFNGSHHPVVSYEDGKVIGRFKLKVLATAGQSTLSSKQTTLFYGKESYQLASEDLTVFVGQAPPTVYTVTYMHNGSVYKTAQTAGKILVDTVPSPAPSGYEFLGWENSGTLYKPGDEFEVTEDVTFTAKWEKIIPVVNYTLTFETNGGTAVNSVTKPKDTTMDLASYVTTKTGYTFAGWHTDAACTKKVTSITLDSNKTVYAKWEEAVAPTYTLTFNTNGGSAISTLTKAENAVVNLASYVPTKAGYTFAGWHTDAALTQKVTSVTMDGNKTVYAKWNVESSGGGGGGGGVTQYTITFKSSDGTELDSVKKNANTIVELEAFTFTKEGYVLEGWYTDKELTQKVTSIKLTKNIILYAKWVKKDTPSKPGDHPDMLTTEHYAYIVGREGNRIEPMANITRAEVATIFFRLLTEEIRSQNLSHTNGFADVNENDWFNTAVSTLAKLGILEGRTADTFAPAANITRAEFTTIAARLSKALHVGEDLFPDIAGHWAKEYINIAAGIGWVVGDNGFFRPDDNITRAEAMTLVNRMLNRVPESTADLLDGMTRWEDNADTNAWYYLAVQEATNSHDCEMKADGVHEKWTALTENPDWTDIEK